MTKWNGERNENVYDRCGIGSHANGVKCMVVEFAKRNNLKWFGNIERMKGKKKV